VEVIGTVPNGKPNAGNPSALLTRTFGGGAAGNLTIETRKLIVQDGGNVSTSTWEGSQGAGGTLRVIASDFVEVSGTEPTDRENPSGLFTQTQGMGNTAALTIKTRILIIRGGAVISSATLSQGNGGTITIDASDLVELSGTSTIGKFPSGLFAQAVDGGNAGSLLINTGKLIVQDKAVIAVSSTGSGQAGNLEINANEIHLHREGKLVAGTTSGDGGNIKLQLQNLLLLRNKSQISTTAGTAGGGGNGGNITIDVPNGFIVAVSGENSDISANAFKGNGGNVQINAFGIFGTEFREKPTNFSDITASSEFGLNGTVEIKTPDIEVSPELINLPTQAVEPKLAQVCQGGVRRNQDSFVITGRGGLPSSPTETLKADAVLADWITLDRVQQTPVNSNVSQNSTSTPARIVEATGWAINAQGKIVLTANASTVTPHNSWQKPTDCSATQP
jgi:large exoprotein involved in heme utilization and adhesion